MSTSADRRRRMVDRLSEDGITDSRVLAAMGTVPRERFACSDLADVAYEETPLPIGGGQTISAPGIVARMAAALRLRGGERVLEIGTGNGYAAAVLASCGARVVSVEYDAELAAAARRCLARVGIDDVEVRHGDGAHGAPDRAPFDAVSMTAMAPDFPPAVLEQVTPGAVLVAPLGVDRDGVLVRRRRGREEHLGPVRFVPMRGASDAVRAAMS
ncbi:protein-L-isoaspartate(D-aspartate) O-methyltransferase [Actinomycetospora termitidis]|uniref:Protein-L-isoaspartate O-methyltransferase n=1 Tax=Actinomycetospora termitidis TaxID=3053470 RepID=A0ABT7MGQ5_9PSEU|nr:protein-L-isoaspartate(D-aspartate) O-methyltransferase [Actinomycetospora sp. Odt1-22]MDL5159864.1 protein-L-isoaspartate(D-aspartate) O-methyltransferase [Actinomycetospora sp. Odt1-22]